MGLQIPSKSHIFKTNEEDPLFWYYFPLISYAYKRRLENTSRLLRKDYQRLLDVGYGSGILFPELTRRAREVFGLEIHGQEGLVQQMLNKEGISNVSLVRGSICEMPFEDNYFHCVVCVSTLEHMHDLDGALREVKRVLKADGEAIFSFPSRNFLTDSFYRIAGHNPRHIHPAGHTDIFQAIKKYFFVEKVLPFPNLPKGYLSLYWSVKCTHD